ncbi:ArsR/SmtB family transcription factor [Streptomyces sp. NPDC050504]|uniref:ArsR/SmtB family transcription factor n=1 Tax=Streptomyces sp. NPDC050504 TaxID=3365618 RepID=UPI00378F5907
MPEIPPERVHELDPRTLRGLAHPLRVQLLNKLRADGPATASRLAASLGESSGATSYHLRQLASYGFIEDAPEHGKGRERWWKATYQSLLFDPKLHHDADPAVRGAANFYFHQIATLHTEEVNTFIGTMDQWRDWDRANDLSDWTLRLTPELATELHQQVHALIDSYREREVAPETEGSAQFRMHVHAFPRATQGAEPSESPSEPPSDSPEQSTNTDPS